MTVPTMGHSVLCANNKRTKEVISCSICAVVQWNRIRLGTPVWVFAPICLDSSDRSLKMERLSIFTSIPRDELRKLRWNPPSHDSSELDRRDGWDGTFLTTWPTPLTGTLAKVDRKKAERINQELQKKVCQTFQTEAAIDLACDQDRVLREYFPHFARSHREEILPPDLEEICEPRHLEQEEDEDDETETAQALSEREKRELFRQHRNLGHPQPTELARRSKTGSFSVCSQRVTLSNMRSATSTAATPSRNVTTLLTF